MPLRLLDPGAWTHMPRLPLGDPYHGVCHARPGELYEPPESEQREWCNCGYARFGCDRFPKEGSADATRFSIVRESQDRVSLVYILEKNCAPAEHRTIEYA